MHFLVPLVTTRSTNAHTLSSHVDSGGSHGVGGDQSRHTVTQYNYVKPPQSVISLFCEPGVMFPHLLLKHLADSAEFSSNAPDP